MSIVLSSRPLVTCVRWAGEESPPQSGLTFLLPLQSCGDSSPDTFSDGLSSSTLPDDHSSYTAQGYMGQDMEVERALTPGEVGRAWPRLPRSGGWLLLLGLGGSVLSGGGRLELAAG